MTTVAALPTIPPFGDALPTEARVETVGIDLPVGRLTASRAVPEGVSKGTILLVPGYTGSKEDHRALLPQLRSRGWTAVAISRRGQADSAAPGDLADYTLDAEAADVIRVAQLLEDGAPVHLLGHSLGGVIARAAVVERPSAFRSLTMLCSGPHGWANRKYLERHLVAEQGSRAYWDATNPATLGIADEDLAPEVRFLKRRNAATSPLSLIGGGQILELPDDTTEALRATGVPVLVAHGVWDAAWPIPWQRDMAARLGAEYVVIPDAYHSPNLENPADTADVLDTFLGAHRA